jgi:NADH dehydrogenase
MRSLLITVLGGTGFVGRALISRLIRDGHQVRVLTRHRARHSDLLVLPGLNLLDTDIYSASALQTAIAGSDAVINLVGILNESGFSGKGFTRAHTELTANVIQACQATGVRRLLHMSALKASADAPSHYLRSKAAANKLIQESSDIDWTIFEPSVIFGPGDSFMNKFAALIKLVAWGHFFAVLPIARGGTRFAPVYIGDVIEAMSRSLADKATVGQRFELCGPDIFTLSALIKYVAQVIRKRCYVLSLPDSIGVVQAALLGLLPGKPLSLDNYRSLAVDSVSTRQDLRSLGVTPTALTSVVPFYLGPRQPAVRYAELRYAAGSRVATKETPDK